MLLRTETGLEKPPKSNTSKTSNFVNCYVLSIVCKMVEQFGTLFYIIQRSSRRRKLSSTFSEEKLSTTTFNHNAEIASLAFSQKEKADNVCFGL